MGLAKHIRQLIRCNNGASAVEFALLAPVYLGALFGIFEIGRIMLITVLLESGIHTAAQDIYRTMNSTNPSTTNLSNIAVNAVRSKSMGMFAAQEGPTTEDTTNKSPIEERASIANVIVIVDDMSFNNGPRLYVPEVTYFYKVPTRLLRNLLGSGITIKASSVAVGMD